MASRLAAAHRERLGELAKHSRLAAFIGVSERVLSIDSAVRDHGLGLLLQRVTYGTLGWSPMPLSAAVIEVAVASRRGQVNPWQAELLRAMEVALLGEPTPWPVDELELGRFESYVIRNGFGRQAKNNQPIGDFALIALLAASAERGAISKRSLSAANSGSPQANSLVRTLLAGLSLAEFQAKDLDPFTLSEPQRHWVERWGRGELRTHTMQTVLPLAHQMDSIVEPA